MAARAWEEEGGGVAVSRARDSALQDGESAEMDGGGGCMTM